jgi:glutamyl-tRNA reductase
MALYAVGLNHRTAPIDVREKVALSPESQGPALGALARDAGALEAVLVSTCNRTEIYFRAEDAEAVRRWLAALPAAAGIELATHLYTLKDDEAARHAFRVAAGLDSMVLGEPQILGQVKHAVRVSAEAGMLGTHLDRLFQHTFAVAKEVRSQTAIGEQSISMAAAALRLANRLFGDLRDTSLLLIGVGEMIELAATHFAAQTPKRIVVANRTLERGQALADRFAAEAITLKELPERFHEFDAVITSTSSTLPIIGKGMVERAVKLRKHRPMFMVDLAVPRDIEAEVSELDDVFLYTLDSLASVVQEGISARSAAVADAEKIIDKRLVEFNDWLANRASVPVIQSLRGKAEQYRQAELARALKLLAKGEDPHKVIEHLSQGLTNKFLHHPMQALNRAEGRERDELARALDKLYPDTDTPSARNDNPDQDDGSDDNGRSGTNHGNS